MFYDRGRPRPAHCATLFSIPWHGGCVCARFIVLIRWCVHRSTRHQAPGCIHTCHSAVAAPVLPTPGTNCPCAQRPLPPTRVVEQACLLLGRHVPRHHPSHDSACTWPPRDLATCRARRDPCARTPVLGAGCSPCRRTQQARLQAVLVLTPPLQRALSYTCTLHYSTGLCCGRLCEGVGGARAWQAGARDATPRQAGHLPKRGPEGTDGVHAQRWYDVAPRCQGTAPRARWRVRG